MNTYSVYMHVTPNNKRYIGITKNKPIKRWANGRAYLRNKHFASAIEKYGWENIKHEILFSKLSKDKALEKEKILIEQYKSSNRNFGYNKTKGGEGTLGLLKTKEQREIQSERMKKGGAPMIGKTHTKEAKYKISKAHKGRKHTEATRKKVSEAGKGRKMSEKCKKALLECNYNRIRTNEEKYKNSINQPNRKEVEQLDLQYNLIKKYVSISDASKKTKIDLSSISRCCNGKVKTAGKSIWRYVKKG